MKLLILDGLGLGLGLDSSGLGLGLGLGGPRVYGIFSLLPSLAWPTCKITSLNLAVGWHPQVYHTPTFENVVGWLG